MSTPVQQEDPNAERWTLIRDIGVLQVKLLLDGLRDLALVPLSLIAGVVSLASAQGSRPGPQFYQLLAWGKKSEHWINLYAALKNAPEEMAEPSIPDGQNIDEIVGRLESFVRDEVRKGGVTAQAKARLDKVLAAFESKKQND